MLNKNYNSTRERLLLPEYGRHIYNIIKALSDIHDKEVLNAAVLRVIDIMGNVNPALRDSPIFRHKLWDHLFIMSDFKLDIDSPYDKPTKEALVMKPRRLEYPKKRFTHKQYGNNIREVLNKLKGVDDVAHVQSVAGDVAKFMKFKSYEYNQEYPCNDVIINDIKNFTDGEIILQESVLDKTKLDYSSKKAIQQRSGSTNAPSNSGRNKPNCNSNNKKSAAPISRGQYGVKQPNTKGGQQNTRPKGAPRRNNNNNNK
ncbi:MAG: DUF4290 domain-containing protein [Rikenellaceae bacterium]